jgi:hypothetical protein
MLRLPEAAHERFQFGAFAYDAIAARAANSNAVFNASGGIGKFTRQRLKL